MHPTSRGKTQNDGWTVDQGLAAQYAAQAGLDPDLAADAGEAVWDVLKSLRDATSETDPGRQAKLVKRTKARLAKANLSRHGELVQHIEARLLAMQGRGGDTELAHLTPGEVIVPPQLQTPEVIQAIHQAAQNAGVDMAQYTAGSQASSVNPETGLEEFSVECADEGGCRQYPGGYRGPTGSYDVYYVGGSSRGNQGNSGEYGTKGNPAGDPPDGIDTYNYVLNKDGTTSFNPAITNFTGVDLSGGIGAGFPGSGRGGGDFVGGYGSGGGYDTDISDSTEEPVNGETDIHGDRPFSNYLSGAIDKSVLETWTDDQLLNELGKIERVQIPASQDTISQTTGFGRNGLPLAGLHQVWLMWNISNTAGRIREICADRMIDCSSR